LNHINSSDEKQTKKKLNSLRNTGEEYHEFENILNSMLDPVHITNSALEIEFVNLACIEEFGSPPPGIKCYEYFHNLGSRCKWCRHEEVMMGTSYHSENYFEKINKYFDAKHSPITKANGEIAKLVILRDITQRKNAEETVRESEACFQALFNAMSEGVAVHEIIYDEKGAASDYVIVKANHAYEMLTGIAIKDAEGKRASELYGTGEPPFIDIYSNVTETGKSHDFVTYFEPMQKYYRISVFTPGKGQFATVFDDITESRKNEKEREKTENALKENEEKFRTLFDKSADVILIADTDGKIIDANEVALARYKYKREEFIGMSIRQLDGPKDARNVPQRIEMIKRSGTAIFEAEHITSDGIIIPTEVNARIVHIAGMPAFLATCRDITERKKADTLIKLEEDRLNALLKLTQMHAGTERDITDFALEEAVRLTMSKGGYLHFFNEDEQTISLYSWSKDVLKTCIAAKDEHYPLDKAGVWADSVRLKKAVIHNDYETLAGKKGYPEGHFHLVRHLGVPIIDGNRIVGVTGVGNKEELYEETDARQLTLLMNSMWGILKQKRMATELEMLAITDGLTGLANRRHFNNMLDLEIKLASRDMNKTLSLLMCDVDFFKRYNDHYGHIAGDRCLQKVADILRLVFKREIDLPTRYGGEEFAVIITDTPVGQVWRLAEELRKEMMAEAIPHAFSSVAPVVTVSVGFVSAGVTTGRSVDWFIQKADEALYRSKAQGRNLVNAVVD